MSYNTIFLYTTRFIFFFSSSCSCFILHFFLVNLFQQLKLIFSLIFHIFVYIFHLTYIVFYLILLYVN